jgi:hypothetical protein
MVDAARTGEVDAYLGVFTGGLEASLRRAVAERTVAAFAAYLRDSSASVKGVAVYDAQWESAEKARVRMDYIYQDRNEKQLIELAKVSNKWKITQFSAGESVKALIPYGTAMRNRWQ